MNSNNNVRDLIRKGIENLLAGNVVKATVADYLKGLEMVLALEPPGKVETEWITGEWSPN